MKLWEGNVFTGGCLSTERYVRGGGYSTSWVGYVQRCVLTPGVGVQGMGTHPPIGGYVQGIGTQPRDTRDIVYYMIH